MIGRRVAVLTFGLVLTVLAVLAQGTPLGSSLAAGSIWWAVPAAVAVAALLAFRAPTLKSAWGRLCLLDGLLWLAVVPPSWLMRASAGQEDFRPEIISDEAARYAVGRALASYLPVLAFWIGAILIVSSIMLLRQRHSRR